MAQSTNKQKIVVAMSGGVDSSVAAFLLYREKYDVIGATMDTGYGRGPEQAAAICDQLHISHYVIDVRKRFEQDVVQGFVQQYLSGRTPNPCVACNAALKFPVFEPLMQELGADLFATGHYVGLQRQNCRYALRCGSDQAKDQSYFLYKLDQATLSRCVFPLAELTKTQIREIAAAAGLHCATQKDSLDVCFIPDGDYRSLLRERAPLQLRPGDIVDQSGKKVGCHRGLANYTVGQRHGLDVAMGYPAYVLQLDIAANRVIIGDKRSLYTTSARTIENNFMLFDQLEVPIRADVKARYRSPAQPATLFPDDNNKDVVRIEFDTPAWAITPGQSAVFYKGDLLLGGGIFL